MNIAIDLDGCIANWTDTFLNFTNVLYQRSNRAEDVTRWNFWECEAIDLTKSQFEEGMELFCANRRWQSINPYPNAVETICAIESLGCRPYYITCRPKGAERATIKFLLGNGFPLGGGIIFCEFSEKGSIAKGLDIEMAIEDKREIVFDYFRKSIVPIMIKYSYNSANSVNRVNGEIEKIYNFKESDIFIVDKIEDCVKIVEEHL